ncbi:MAG: electron transfer flavoprotein subunit alpha/FixB family protein [candidate division WOR-3 bacterium]
MKIYVFSEVFRGEIGDITFEMLGIAKELKEKTNGEVVSILIGKGVKNLKDKFGSADKILILDDERLEGLSPFLYQNILLNILKERNPDLILFPHTAIGMDIGGFVALKLGYPFVAFCKSLNLKNGNLVVTSLICGGKILVDVNLKENKGVCLIAPGSYSAEKGKEEGAKNVEEIPLQEIQEKIKFEEYIEPKIEDIDISKKDILISVGRGIQSKDNIPLAEEIANLLNGAVSGSRPVIDQGWLPITRQVGRSGKIVKPKLYLAFGISGAPEHIEGMRDSELIVAINMDPNAPIFNIAHYGVVGDALEIMPLLAEEIKKRKK